MTSAIWISREAMRRDQRGQRRQVVDVLQALARGLEQDREVGVLAGDVEQLRGALPLLPQRGAGAGVAAGQQQRAGGALAEAGREQRRAADLLGDDLVELVGLEDEQLGARRLGLGVGDARDDAVVAGHDRAVDAVALEDAGADGERPRGVDPPAERASAGRRASRRARRGSARRRRVRSVGTCRWPPLVAQEGAEVVARPGGRGPAGGALGQASGAVPSLADEVADGLAELVRAPDRVALPERQPGRLAERRA